MCSLLGLASAMYQQMKAAQDLEARRVAEKVELESKVMTGYLKRPRMD